MPTPSKAPKATAPSFEMIAVADVVKSPRGRKAELDPTLVAAFEQITSDEQALRLSGFGPFATKEDRAAFSTIVRKNWTAACKTHKAKINYGTDGVAQVQRGKVVTAD